MLKVLIADDELIIRDGLSKYIPWKELGLEVVAVESNGEKALSAFLKKPTDIILTDIEMPKMNGFEFLEEIKNKGYKPYVLIISGYDNFKYAQKAIKLNVSDYILKPINKTKLISQLKELINRINKDASLTKAQHISPAEYDNQVLTNNLKDLHIFNKVEPFIIQTDINLSITTLKDCWNILLEKNTPFNFLIRFSVQYALALSDFCVSHYIALSKVFGDEDPSYELLKFDTQEKIIATLSLWTEKIIQNLSSTSKAQNAIVSKALMIIHTSLNDSSLSVNTLADKLNVSPNYLSAKFKEKMNINCNNYITSKRIEKAKELLKDIDLKVYEIAEAVGINDYRYFTKLFKDETGVCPVDYRNTL